MRGRSDKNTEAVTEVLGVAWGGAEWEEQMTQVWSEKHLGTGRGTTDWEGAAQGKEEEDQHSGLLEFMKRAWFWKERPGGLPSQNLTFLV